MAKRHPKTIGMETLAAAREIARSKRDNFAGKPTIEQLLDEQELENGAPFYFVLRDFIQQLKESRLRAGQSLSDVSTKSGIAVESLSRLETGAQTNPTWKTLALYAVAVGVRPELSAKVEKGSRIDSARTKFACSTS